MSARRKKEESFRPSVEMWSIENVVPYALNSKKHPPEQIAKLISAIAEFGWDVPIVVDEDGIILKGHGRRLAALQMNLKQVPVIVRKGLSDAEKKAIRISDNRIAQSEWDADMLRVELEALSELNFDLNLTGFDEDEWSNFAQDAMLDFQPPEDDSDGENESEEGREEQINNQWSVLVQCHNERKQLELLQRLTEEGYECRSLIS